MKPDEFENQLRSLPRRRVPSSWREEILAAARAAASPRAAVVDRRPAPWWRELFWPSPTAWAGLAVVWMIIGGLYATQPTESVSFAGPSVPSPAATPEGATALALQRHELASLLESTPEPNPAPKPNQSIQPNHQL